jgi:hypothetical protein
MRLSILFSRARLWAIHLTNSGTRNATDLWPFPLDFGLSDQPGVA